MKNFFSLLLTIIILSCNRQGSDTGSKIITVSIAPYKYFVEAIAGDDFKVNVMVPSGSNPHIYEPFPEQITKLRKSVAYISNGYLGFEMTWLDRFYETNRAMKKLSLGDKIDPIVSQHKHEGDDIEGADPHYWVSPKCALIIASSIKDLLCELAPEQKGKYSINYMSLIEEINRIDKKAQELFAGFQNKSFMIFHPNLGYLARDYGLEEIPVEYEGKEPTPARLRELVDRARKDDLKIIFIQREYDSKNARAIAGEIGAEVVVLDPLSENWPEAISNIVDALHNSFKKSQK